MISPFNIHAPKFVAVFRVLDISIFKQYVTAEYSSVTRKPQMASPMVRVID